MADRKYAAPWTTAELNQIKAWVATVPPIIQRRDPTFVLIPTRQGFTDRSGKIVRKWVLESVAKGTWRTATPIVDPHVGDGPAGTV